MAIIEASISNFEGQTFIGNGTDTLKLVGNGVYRFDKSIIRGFSEITTSNDVTIVINSDQLIEITNIFSSVYNDRNIYIYGQNVDLRNMSSFNNFRTVIQDDNAVVRVRTIEQALKLSSRDPQNDTIIVGESLTSENRNKLHNNGFETVTDISASSVNTKPVFKNLDQKTIKVAKGQAALINPQGDAAIVDDDTTVTKLKIQLTNTNTLPETELLLGANFRLDGTEYGASFYYKGEKIGTLNYATDGFEIIFNAYLPHSTINEFIRTLSYKPSKYAIIDLDTALKITITDPGGRSSTASLSLNITDPIHLTTGYYIKQGTALADTLLGSLENEIFFPDNGKDFIFTGSGKDIVAFQSSPTNGNRDRISDFSVRDDTIWLDNDVFKKLGTKGSELAPFKLSKKFFSLGDAAKDKNDYIIYNNKNGILYYDKDGSGPGKAAAIAELPKKLKMSYNDFYIV